MSSELEKPSLADIEWLKEQFEFQYCDECGGDWYDHNLVLMNLGAYGSGYRFARCKIADYPRYKVRARERKYKVK